MTDWYERPGAGWVMRLGGLALIGISTLAGMAVYHQVRLAPPHEATPFECLLALVTFLAGSAGSTMAVLGQHLFDRVEVSNRWARYFSRRPDDGNADWR